MDYFSLTKDAALGGLAACALWTAWKFWSEDKKQGDDPARQVEALIHPDMFGGVDHVDSSLSEVSVIWTTPVDGVIKFSDLSILWRAPVTKKVEPIFPIPDFAHGEITRFWVNQIEPRHVFTLERKHQVAELLKILDLEGSCSSVVKGHTREAELAYDPTSYDILSRVELWDHSIRVAEIFIEKVKQIEINIPYAVLIALGHDLGKIPRIYNRMYKTGDHPTLARFVLEECDYFNKHPKAKEILLIISEHHLPGSKVPLAVQLRECDTEARQAELMKVVKRDLLVENPPPAKPKIEVITALGNLSDDLPSPATPAETSAAEVLPIAPAPAAAAPLPEFSNVFAPPPGKHKHQSVRKLSPPPDWLEVDTFRSAMRKRINLVEQGNWEAVSTGDGIVWYRYNAIVNAIREASNQDPQVLGLAVDRERMGDLIFSIFKAMGEDCVAWNIMGDNYTATKCLIENGAGKVSNSPTFLTPIKASWFFTTASSLEQEKTADIRRQVTKIHLANDRTPS